MSAVNMVYLSKGNPSAGLRVVKITLERVPGDVDRALHSLGLQRPALQRVLLMLVEQGAKNFGFHWQEFGLVNVNVESHRYRPAKQIRTVISTMAKT